VTEQPISPGEVPSADDDGVNAPKGDRIGNDYSRGPNPNPGGDIDLGGSAVPPYDDRSTGDDEVAAGVPRAMGSEGPTEEPRRPGEGPPPAGGDTLDSDDQAPDNVGESISRRGEDQADKEGGETGRIDHGEEPDTGRPAGGSTPRDQTSINPHEDDRIS
jgi:hypothetical protein